ncbi:Noc2-domain-containing protein [Trichodelitschia bisporula]|uniref:Noc2-domain-containing protein n=1 Tax=Trichodelitschia bisporula TaxID=703511 RepID=A0A6G1I0I3_9PEZI|nr:Noc2-domain-containing protein [Trichodelitschia bisporula]
MAQSKSTKKFEKHHLKDTLKRRKESAKIKQRNQLAAKKKSKRPEQDEATETKPAKADAAFESMTVDDFFQSGFDLPENPKANKKRKRAPAKEDATSADSDDGDDSPDSEVPGVDADESAPDSDDDPELHKQQLEALAEKDPEFYKFLKDNDAGLLDFEEDLALDLSDDDRPSKKRKSEDHEVTEAMLTKWQAAMADQKSLRAMKEVVLAFRAAAHVNDDGKAFKYTVSSSESYHKLLTIGLKHIPEVLEHHLPVKTAASGKVNLNTDSKKYRTLTPILKSYILSVQALLEGLADDATLRLTLTSVLPLLPYILSFKKIIRDFTKLVVNVWSSGSSTEAARIAAFLVLRKLVVIGDPGIREAVLKATYQGLVKGSRNTTVHTIQAINLMKNSAAELWGLDANVGYTTGFSFIRQLAIHLRSSITNPTRESYKTIYNWQFVHSLDFWSRVLAQHCATLREAETGKQSPLRPLIYPTVQVTLGAMRLIPTAQYFPLRFQLARALCRLSLATTTYIPLAPALYEVLNSAELRKAPKASTLKAVDFTTAIRVPKSYLRTRTYQDGLGEQVAELYSEFLVLWCKSISFPELVLPIVVLLRRWLKEVGHKTTGNKNGKINAAIALVVQKVEANSAWIEERRARVDFAPNNRAGVESFLKEDAWESTPLGAFVVGQRKTREEKARLVDEGRRAEEKKRRPDASQADAEAVHTESESDDEGDESE